MVGHAAASGGGKKKKKRKFGNIGFDLHSEGPIPTPERGAGEINELRSTGNANENSKKVLGSMLQFVWNSSFLPVQLVLGQYQSATGQEGLGLQSSLI